MWIKQRLEALNNAQKQAVTEIKNSLSLTAGAGTGKTKVLTERFMYILDQGELPHGKEVESILAITFTNKATSEMISRIRSTLYEISREEVTYRRYYKDSMRANIYTIHGFCAKILRENPVESKIDPNFTIADEHISSKLLMDSIGKVLEDYSNSNELVELLLQLEYSSLKNLQKDIKNLYYDLKNKAIEPSKIKVEKPNSTEIIRDIEPIIELFEDIANCERANSKMKKYMDSEDYRSAKSENLTDLEYYNFLNRILDSRGTGKGNIDKKQELSNLIERELEKAESINSGHYIFIKHILEEIDTMYGRKKKSENLLDYDDLQIKAKELLNNIEVLNKYKEQYKYIMIDEYQDTNSLQREIFTKIANLKDEKNSNNLFIVGDPKQSIYGFRGSNLKEFYNTTEEIKASGGKNLVMGENYRSSQSVINYINELFKNLMARDYESLDAKVPFENYEVELLLDSREGTGKEKRKYEAENIADKIVDLVNNGCDYKDIAILFRVTTNIAIYEEALREKNIPYVNNSSKEFYRRMEIVDIVNLLKVLANDKDKVSVIGLLRSPMVGLTDQSIYGLFQRDFNFEEYKQYKFLEQSEYKLLEEASEKIIMLKRYKYLLSLEEYVYLAINTMEYLQLVNMGYRAVQASENVEKFLDITKDFQNISGGKLEDFIDYLCEKEKEDEKEAQIFSQPNAVNLMTIHASKGLEFKAVIVPNLNFNKRNTGGGNNINYSEETGFGINIKNFNIAYTLNRRRVETFENEELIRVLYVAATRAKERLIFSLSATNINEKNPKPDFAHMVVCNSKNLASSSHKPIEKDSKSKFKCIKESLLNTSHTVKPNSYLIKDKYIDRFSNIDYYSPTAYMLFKKDKREYYNRYILKLDFNLIDESAEIIEEDELVKRDYNNKIIDAATRGSIVHKFAELYKSSSNKTQLLRQILQDYGVEDTEEVHNELDYLIDNYLNWNKDFDFESEVEIYYKHCDFVIRGYIDRIYFRDNKIKIIDFKTNKLIDQERIDYYAPQLQIYSAMAQAVYKREVESAELIFLENTTSISVDVSKVALDSRMKDFAQFVDYVERYRNISEYPTEH